MHPPTTTLLFPLLENHGVRERKTTNDLIKERELDQRKE